MRRPRLIFFADAPVAWSVVSSGDVYRAYGRFTGVEPGPVEAGLLREDSPLRTVLYPYRDPSKPADDLGNFYEKILMERVALRVREQDIASGAKAHSNHGAADSARLKGVLHPLPGTVLRLPKVYGPDDNAELATVYAFRNHPQWRWTHGYVENVAAAIALAAGKSARENRPVKLAEIYREVAHTCPVS